MHAGRAAGRGGQRRRKPDSALGAGRTAGGPFGRSRHLPGACSLTSTTSTVEEVDPAHLIFILDAEQLRIPANPAPSCLGTAGFFVAPDMPRGNRSDGASAAPPASEP